MVIAGVARDRRDSEKMPADGWAVKGFKNVLIRFRDVLGKQIRSSQILLYLRLSYRKMGKISTCYYSLE